VPGPASPVPAAAPQVFTAQMGNAALQSQGQAPAVSVAPGQPVPFKIVAGDGGAST